MFLSSTHFYLTFSYSPAIVIQSFVHKIVIKHSVSALCYDRERVVVELKTQVSLNPCPWEASAAFPCSCLLRCLLCIWNPDLVLRREIGAGDADWGSLANKWAEGAPGKQVMVSGTQGNLCRCKWWQRVEANSEENQKNCSRCQRKIQRRMKGSILRKWSAVLVAAERSRKSEKSSLDLLIRILMVKLARGVL